MRKLVVVEFLSLDGVYQAPGGPEEDTEGGFKHGGWQVPYSDDVFGSAAGESMAETDVNLFGRKTYEIMAAYWPNAPSDNPYAQHLNNVQASVASRTLKKVEFGWSTTCFPSPVDPSSPSPASRLQRQSQSLMEFALPCLKSDAERKRRPNLPRPGALGHAGAAYEEPFGG
jgi:hypothetical protein